MERVEFRRLYGPWASRTPDDAARLLARYDRPWWVVGGWAIEAFTGVRREHEDCDLSVLRVDLPAVRRHLAGRFDTWMAFSGALRPLLPDDRPDAEADDVLPDGCSQLWLREGASNPWEFDLQLTQGKAGMWVCHRDASITLPLDAALWERDGVRYLRPELQLIFKARHQRPKDEADLTACLPLLDDAARERLRTALVITDPGHPWIDRLDPRPGDDR